MAIKSNLGFSDHVVKKMAEVERVCLPVDANRLFSVSDHCLRSPGLKVRVINVGNLMKFQPTSEHRHYITDCGEDHPFVLGWRCGKKSPVAVKESLTEGDNVWRFL